MKTIKSILKHQTCGIFPEEWYKITAKLIEDLTEIPMTQNIMPEFEDKFQSFQPNVRYYNMELNVVNGYEKRTFLKNLSIFCVMSGNMLKKGADHKGRYFEISALS